MTSHRKVIVELFTVHFSCQASHHAILHVSRLSRDRVTPSQPIAEELHISDLSSNPSAHSEKSQPCWLRKGRPQPCTD